MLLLLGTFRRLGGSGPAPLRLLWLMPTAWLEVLFLKEALARAGVARLDPGEGAQVDIYRDRNTAPLVDLRGRLRAVLDIIGSIGRSGFSVA